MREAGKIIHYTKNRVFVIEATQKVTLDTYLVDASNRIVAKIIDVIGPINKPYLVAKPLVERPEKYVGAIVYYQKTRRR